MNGFDTEFLADLAATDHTAQVLARGQYSVKETERQANRKAALKWAEIKAIPEAIPAGQYEPWLEEVRVEAERGLGLNILMRTPRVRRHDRTPINLPVIEMAEHFEPWEWPHQPLPRSPRHVIFGDLEFKPEAEAARKAEMLRRWTQMNVICRENSRRASGSNPDEEQELMAASALVVCETVVDWDSTKGPFETICSIRNAKVRGDWRNWARHSSEFGGDQEMNRTITGPDGEEMDWDELVPSTDPSTMNPEDIVIQAEERTYDDVPTAEMRGEMPWLARMGLNPAMKVINVIHRFASRGWIEKHGGIEKVSGLTSDQLSMTVKELYNSFVIPGFGNESEAEDRQTAALLDKIKAQRAIPGDTPYFVGKHNEFTYGPGKGLVPLIMDTSPCFMPVTDEPNQIHDDRERKPTWMPDEKQPFEDNDFFDLEDLPTGRFLRHGTMGFSNPEGWDIGELVETTPSGKIYLAHRTYLNRKGVVVTRNKWHQRGSVFVIDRNDGGEVVRVEHEPRFDADAPFIPVKTDDQWDAELAKESGYATLQAMLDQELGVLGYPATTDEMLREMWVEFEKSVPTSDPATHLSRVYVVEFARKSTQGFGFKACVEAGKAAHHKAWALTQASKKVSLKEAPKGASPITPKEGTQMVKNIIVSERVSALMVEMAKEKHLPSQNSWKRAQVDGLAHGTRILARADGSNTHLVWANVKSSANGPIPYQTVIAYSEDGLGNHHLLDVRCNCPAGEGGVGCKHGAAVAQLVSKMDEA